MGIPKIADLTPKGHLIVVGEVIRSVRSAKMRCYITEPNSPSQQKGRVPKGRVPYGRDAERRGDQQHPYRVSGERKHLRAAGDQRTHSEDLPHAFLTERDEGYGVVEPAQSMMPMSRDLSALPYPSGLDTYTRVPQYLATMRHKNLKSCPMRIRKNSTLDDKPNSGGVEDKGDRSDSRQNDSNSE
jgi:hypothetical protein